MLLKDVWHRGAMMIIKKFKFLKRRGLSDGKWTFSGFHEGTKESNLTQDISENNLDNLILTYIKLSQSAHNTNPVAVREGLEFDAMLTHLFNDIDMEELVDIRENSAYVAFVQLIGGYINYEEDGYDILAKEYKRELKYSGGNLLAIQLREIVEKSAKEFTEFFTKIPDFSVFKGCFREAEELHQRASSKHIETIKDYVESAKDIPKSPIIYKHPHRHTTSSSDIQFTKTGAMMSK